MLTSPVRKIEAKVEFFEGSTLVETCQYNDRLISFTVERIGDTSKFFGFGICQRLNVHLIDRNRELSFSTANSIKISYGVNGEFIYPYPTFHISEIHRDENTNELSITAYDLMYPDTAHVISDMQLPESYNLMSFATAAATALKASGLAFKNIPDSSDFLLNLPKGGNFEGHETVRQGLNALAEATQTIYYINHDDQLVFTRLNKDAAPDLSITKSDYISLSSSTNRRLGTIYHATELGDDISASYGTGTTQFVRDNAFWTLFSTTEVLAFLERGVELVGGLTINQFDCSWRGNFLLEIGDKVALTAKDDSILTAYVLDDVFTYNGSFSEKTQWNYIDNNNETPETPNSLGDALNQTFARVDKVNKEITLQAGKIDEISEEVGSLKITTDDILIKVEKIDTDIATVAKEAVDAALGNELTTINEELASLRIMSDEITGEVVEVKTTTNQLDQEIQELTHRVDTSITSEQVSIIVQETVNNTGVSEVTTETGFTFNADGMTIDKVGTEMKTTITEDGMIVYRDNNQVLTANNEGVYATNLYASTFIILGELCRFEEYIDHETEEQRVGCFWIKN